MIEDGITPQKKMFYSEMTMDHYNAFEYVMEQSSKQTLICVEQIKHIASLVMKRTGTSIYSALGITDASKGDFRKVNVSAGSAYFMNYDKVPMKVAELVEKINDALKLEKDLTCIQQLQLSFYAHYELVNIHPFLDGNGRIARLLMNYIQNYFSLPLGIVYVDDKLMYYNALNKVRDKEDIQSFYDFMFCQYEKFLSEEIEKANKIDNSKPIKFR